MQNALFHSAIFFYYKKALTNAKSDSHVNEPLKAKIDFGFNN